MQIVGPREAELSWTNMKRVSLVKASARGRKSVRSFRKIQTWRFLVVAVVAVWQIKVREAGSQMPFVA